MVVSNRLEVLNFIKRCYNLKEDLFKTQGKQLLTILLYGGTIPLWKRINEIQTDLKITC